MSLAMALRGVRVELLQACGVVPKIRCLARLSALIVADVWGTLGFARYGWRAMCLHKDIAMFAPSRERSASIFYDARYGPKPRNLLDIYHAKPSESSGIVTCAPAVVLFVHGGVWCSGEKWQYAPIGRSLSMQGVTACVMSYTLYPEASAKEIAEEVNAALDWVMDNVGTTYATPPQVTLVGHSSGAHTAMMAILERAKQAKKMPESVVAMCGVYDIATHYEYERGRGVNELSSMKGAMGGRDKFAEQSPTCILSNPANSNGFSSRHVDRLPKIVLVSSKKDTTVPSSQSEALHHALQEHGCASQCIVYDDVLHSHFATKSWTADLFDRANDPPHVFISDFVSTVKSTSPTQNTKKRPREEL